MELGGVGLAAAVEVARRLDVGLRPEGGAALREELLVVEGPQLAVGRGGDDGDRREHQRLDGLGVGASAGEEGEQFVAPAAAPAFTADRRTVAGAAPAGSLAATRPFAQFAWLSSFADPPAPAGRRRRGRAAAARAADAGTAQPRQLRLVASATTARRPESAVRSRCGKVGESGRQAPQRRLQLGRRRGVDRRMDAVGHHRAHVQAVLAEQLVEAQRLGDGQRVAAWSPARSRPSGPRGAPSLRRALLEALVHAGQGKHEVRQLAQGRPDR